MGRSDNIKRKINYWQKWWIGFSIIIVLAYLSGVLLGIDWNPFKWGVEVRTGVVVASMSVVVIYGVYGWIIGLDE